MGFEGLNAKRALYISVAVSLVAHVVLFVLLAYLPEEETPPPAPYVVSIVEPQAEEPSPEPEIEEPVPEEEPPVEEPPQPEEEIEEVIIVKVPELEKEPVFEEPPQVMEDLDEEITGGPEGESEEEPSKTVEGEIHEEVPSGPETDVGIAQLFDKQVIEELAKVEPSEEAKDEITFDAEGFKYQSYKRMLFNRMQWALDMNPLNAAVPVGTQVWYEMVIRRDGSLKAIKIVKPSGYEVFDKHVVRILKGLAPFWPLPEGWNESQYSHLGAVVIRGKSPFFIFVR
jgi:TonB family protein